MDAPRHFIPGGATVDVIPLERLVGPATLCNLSHIAAFQEVDVPVLARALDGPVPERIVMRFDWSAQLGTMSYYTDHPFLSTAAAQWLVDQGCLLLGMDTPMPDDPRNGRGTPNNSPNHKILLGAGCILVEYLTNLSSLRTRSFDLVVAPLKIEQGDGAPVRCFAIERDQTGP